METMSKEQGAENAAREYGPDAGVARPMILAMLDRFEESGDCQRRIGGDPNVHKISALSRWATQIFVNLAKKVSAIETQMRDEARGRHEQHSNVRARLAVLERVVHEKLYEQRQADATSFFVPVSFGVDHGDGDKAHITAHAGMLQGMNTAAVAATEPGVVIPLAKRRRKVKAARKLPGRKAAATVKAPKAARKGKKK